MSQGFPSPTGEEKPFQEIIDMYRGYFRSLPVEAFPNTVALADQLVEGGPEPKRIVMLEFADKAAVKRWYNSPEYQKILPDRLANSTGRAFIVEGV